MRRIKSTYLAIIIILAYSLASCSSVRDNGTDLVEQTESAVNEATIEPATDNRGDTLAWMLAYDIRELLGEEPFNASDIPDTMQVYRNRYITDGAGVPLEPISKERMSEIGKDIADLLGIKVVSEDSFGANHLDLLSDEISIYVEGNESVRIEFGKTYPLPVDSESENSGNIGSGQEAYVEALNYASKVLDPILTYWGLEDLTPRVYYEYTFDGEKNIRCVLIGKGEYPDSLIVNFSDGYLDSIRKGYYAKPTGEVFGEYPTISYGEAQEMLVDGSYYSIVPLDAPIQKEEIVGAIIGYKTQCYDEMFLPFYVFYVDISSRREVGMPDESKELGLRNYATYLVPAIEPEFLKELPEIEVYFN